MEPKKPTFLIVGSAKCGTTALASILDTHPDCCMSRPKEISYFQDTIDRQPNPNYAEGWNWYQQYFSHYNGESMVGEATPSYSDRSRSPMTAKRIHTFNPNIKIIYMVRDPLQRQISAWKMQYDGGKLKSAPWRREHQWALDGFDHWMQRQREVKQWDTCRYGYQLAAYEALFPVENICVSFLEEWKRSKESEVRRIMTFLGLDPDSWLPNSSENANRGSDRKIVHPLIQKLRMLPQVQGIVKHFPISMREWVREIISRPGSYSLSPEISDKTRNEFTRYVLDDAHEFLKRYGKSTDLWPTIVNNGSMLTC